MEVQAWIPVALSALHNFICIHDPKEGPVIGNGNHNSADGGDGQEGSTGPVLEDGNSEEELDAQWDQIAKAMWADYQRICQESGINIEDPFDSGHNGIDVDEDDDDEDDEDGEDDNNEDDNI